MKIDYKVHGVSRGTAMVQAEVDGETLMASVPCLEVELVTTSQRHGNQILRFTGDSIDAATETFPRDGEIIATFELKK